MRKILFLLQKEFLQLIRNKTMIPILFVMPVVQLFLLSYAANYEIKQLNIFIVDHDRSETSNRLIHKLNGSGYYQITGYSNHIQDGYDALEKDKADLTLQIPTKFEHDLNKYEHVKVQLLINAIDGIKAGLSNAYTSAVLADFNKDILMEQSMLKSSPFKQIIISTRNWFNPQLDYKTFMVPGILVLLVTMIAVFLTGMNIVREKEIGTIEQINVTTLKKYEFIIGKLLPFLLIALFELAIGLLIARFYFKIPMEGSVVLIFTFSLVYMILVLGIGMFISTISNTQQQALFISWFFMVIFILMSGLFTSIENMPRWAQLITKLNPVSYFIEIMRMVMLKGSGFMDSSKQFLAISVYAIVMNGLAILNYRKTAS